MFKFNKMNNYIFSENNLKSMCQIKIINFMNIFLFLKYDDIKLKYRDKCVLKLLFLNLYRA